MLQLYAALAEKNGPDLGRHPGIRYGDHIDLTIGF
jgi:hypothetical protein